MNINRRRIFKIGGVTVAVSIVAAAVLWAVGDSSAQDRTILAANQRPMRASALNPTITTAPGPGSTVTLGTVLTDHATLTGTGPTPTGLIQFKLFDPAGTTAGCTGTPAAVFTSSLLTLAAGQATATGPAANTVGTWSWVVNYAGDGNYNSFSSPASGCGTEQVSVLRPNPVITTTTGPANPVLGSVLTDSATLTGPAGTPTGLVQFKLFDPAGTAAGCTRTPAAVFTSSNLTLVGGVASVTGVAANTAGTWSWVVNYGGDGTYNSFSSPASGCGTEQVTIAHVNPTVVTTTSPANPSLGSVLGDSVVVSGPAGLPTPTGFVAFQLFAPGTNCAGTPFFDSRGTTNAITPLNGSGQASVSGSPAVNAAGTWNWILLYSGDTVYNSWQTSCGAEPVTIAKAGPNISTVQTPTRALIGGTTLSDTATLPGAVNPTGTIRFRLFNSNQPTCTGTPVIDQTVNLAGGSATITVPTPFGPPGTWNWLATYSGDSNNNGTQSVCGAEKVQMISQAPPVQQAPPHHHHTNCVASRDPNPNCGG